MTIEENQIPGKTVRLRDLGCPLRGWPTGPLALSQSPPLEPGPGCSHVSWNRQKTALGPSPRAWLSARWVGIWSPAFDRPAGPKRGRRQLLARRRLGPPRRGGSGPNGRGEASVRSARTPADHAVCPQISAAAPSEGQRRSARLRTCSRAATPRGVRGLHGNRLPACERSLRLGLGTRVGECTFSFSPSLGSATPPIASSSFHPSMWAWEWTWGSPASVAAPKSPSIFCFLLDSANRTPRRHWKSE